MNEDRKKPSVSKIHLLVVGLFARYWKQILRYGIAIAGIYLVVSGLTLHDHVLVYNARTSMVELVGVEGSPKEDMWPVTVTMEDGSKREVTRNDVLTQAELATAVRASDHATLYLRGVSVRNELYASESKKGTAKPYSFDAFDPPFRPQVQFPAKAIGLNRMLSEADWRYLLLAVLVIPLVYVITGYRWWLLLQGLEVPIALGRALQINMVGAFYNTFMPGSTGGDVLKAYYAAKNAQEHRTRAVMSVIVDRAIGLIALIIMGGVAASFQWEVPECRRVAMAALVIIVTLAVGIVVVGYGPVRRALGLEWVLGKLPMQDKVVKATEAMRLYKRRPGMVLATLLMSFPVHGTVVVSAMFAGWAFGLNIKPMYYWVVVPTVVLSGALPISPQGAGVMEYFAIKLLQPRGVTVGQAFALTLSIRLVQIIWNLLAGLLVLKGGYHAPSEAEQQELEVDEAPHDKPATKV